MIPMFICWELLTLLIIVLYVDDLLITCSSDSVIVAVKNVLYNKFSMTDMGPLHFFLGLEISQVDLEIKLSQAKYARDLLVRFNMTDCKTTSTPFLSEVKLEDGGDTALVDSTKYCQLVGSLLYLTHSSLSRMRWEQFPSTCRSRMSYTGKLPSASSDISKVPPVMGFIMQQDVHWTSSAIQIQIGLVIA